MFKLKNTKFVDETSFDIIETLQDSGDSTDHARFFNPIILMKEIYNKKLM